MKILNTIGDQFNPEAKKILEQAGEVEYRALAQDELKGAIKNCNAIVVGLGLRLDAGIIDAGPNVKLIATATTGLDHIDVSYAQEKGIEVLSLQDEDLREVTGTAELAFGLLLSLVRRIPESFDDVKSGNWSREKFLGNNLSGKMLGIVGLGRLGSMVAQYGKAFGMRVIAHDPHKEESDSAKIVDFNMLLSESDVVSIHAPLNEETKDLFNKETFRQMKSGAYLINTSRGALVNESDLLEALEHKIIAGYGADVLVGETEFGNNASNHPIVKYAKLHNNVVITPHIGGFTQESRAVTDLIIAEKIVRAQ
ncbi:MAG: hypothetical protein HYT31_00670 [Parcubacteria group bacterium]|nr:hypothetical protein [Parcubacteria group bacterium]